MSVEREQRFLLPCGNCRSLGKCLALAKGVKEIEHGVGSAV